MLRVRPKNAPQESVCDSSADVRKGLLADDFFQGDCVYSNAAGFVNLKGLVKLCQPKWKQRAEL
jgi:hypothetical protein